MNYKKHVRYSAISNLIQSLKVRERRKHFSNSLVNEYWNRDKIQIQNFCVQKTYKDTLMKWPLVQQMKNVSFSFQQWRGWREKSLAALGSYDWLYTIVIWHYSSHRSFAILDGLTDCMDPDCCIQSPCQNSPLCRGSRDPLQVIQQGQHPEQKVRSFYDRVKMLVGRDSTHIIPADNPFNAR